MRVRNCIRIYYMIPDSRGISIRMARVPEDWSLTGYVARQIGRVWLPLAPKSAGQHSEPSDPQRNDYAHDRAWRAVDDQGW